MSAYVMMAIEEYWRLNGPGISVGDALGHSASAHIAFEPPRLRDIISTFEFNI